MTGTRKYFGTDGIRGEVGRPPITVDFVLRLGWAAGTVLAGGGRGKMGGKYMRGMNKLDRLTYYLFSTAGKALIRLLVQAFGQSSPSSTTLPPPSLALTSIFDGRQLFFNDLQVFSLGLTNEV